MMSHGQTCVRQPVADGHGLDTPVTVYLDSRDRDTTAYPTSGACVLRLPQQLRGVKSVAVVAAEVPATYKQFTSARNNTSLVLTIAGSTKTVTIPDESATIQYTASSIATALSTAIAAQSGWSTYSASITNNVLTIAAAGQVSVSTVGLSGLGLWYYLGFAPNATLTGTGSVTAPYKVNITTPYIMFDIAEVGRHTESAVGGAGAASSGFPLAKLQLEDTSASTLFYTGRNPRTAYLMPDLNRLDRVTARWRFHTGETVDFIGGDWSVTLEIVTARGGTTT